MSRVAVIIPGYNHGHYIEEAVRSALEQTRKPDRIIVIDDGSLDNTAEVAEQAGATEVHRQENRGAHATLNRLVDMAAEDCSHIAILNSDDRFLPTRLESCHSAIQGDPQIQVVATPLELMDDDGELLGRDHPRSRWFETAWSFGSNDEITLAEWLGASNFIATTSNVFATAEYLQANPFKSYRYAHDYAFLAKAAIDGVLHVRQGGPTIRYRVHANNTITTTPAALVREMLKLHLDLYADIGRDLNMGDAEIEVARRRAFYDFSRASWDSISSHHAGLLQLSLARVAAGELPEDILNDLPAMELKRFPNRALVNARTAGEPSRKNAGLAEKFERLKEDRDGLKRKADAATELARLRAILTSSRWVALAGVLGVSGELRKNDGKTPSEKLEHLNAAIAESCWLRLGERFFSKGARLLLDDDPS